MDWVGGQMVKGGRMCQKGVEGFWGVLERDLYLGDEIGCFSFEVFLDII